MATACRYQAGPQRRPTTGAVDAQLKIVASARPDGVIRFLSTSRNHQLRQGAEVRLLNITLSSPG
jgi:hypothetical protein